MINLKNLINKIKNTKYIQNILHSFLYAFNIFYKVPFVGTLLLKFINLIKFFYKAIYNKLSKFIKFFQISKNNTIPLLNTDPNIVSVLINTSQENQKFKKLFTISFTLIVILLCLIGFKKFHFYNSSSMPDIKISKGFVAHIAIEGVIHKDKDIYDSLVKIESNDSIKAVILSINSPGGSVEPSERIFQLIRKIDEKKPVVVCMESLAASGGYMIAVAGRHIFAMNSTITGSIGVYTQSLEIVELAQKLGIKMNYIKTSPIKGSPHMFEKISDDVIKMEQDLIMQMHDLFKNIVAERRGMTKQEVDFISQGQIFTGMSALKYRLIDEIGNENDALKWLVDQKLVSKDIKMSEIHLKPEKDSTKFFSFAKQIGQNFTEGLLLSFKEKEFKEFMY